MERYLAPPAPVPEQRAKYRSGRKEKAVKVYTVNQESKYIIILNIPTVGAQKELLQQLSLYGTIIQWRMLDEYPHEEFTEVMWVQYEHIDNARHAKKKLDDYSFFGLQLRVVYAPEYETADDCWAKLRDRRNTIGLKLAELLRSNANAGQHHQQQQQSSGTGKRHWQDTQQQQGSAQPAGSDSLSYIAALSHQPAAQQPSQHYDPQQLQYAQQYDPHYAAQYYAFYGQYPLAQQYAQIAPSTQTNPSQEVQQRYQHPNVHHHQQGSVSRRQTAAVTPTESVQQTVQTVRNKLAKIGRPAPPRK